MQNLNNIKVILDTHLFVWVMDDNNEITKSTKTQIHSFLKEGALGVCAISLWEISMLERRRKIQFNQTCLAWIENSLKAPGITLCPLTPEICVSSTSLPDEFHGDPADRMIVATARSFGVPLMTRDKKILEYSKKGYVNCIAV